jgi:hypothetical protein
MQLMGGADAFNTKLDEALPGRPQQPQQLAQPPLRILVRLQW